MKSLFPDMDREIREDRKAARREEVQRSRERLKDKDLSWLINYLLEHGPQTECNLMLQAMDEQYHLKPAMEAMANTIFVLYDLWMVRKLWRVSQGIHPQSGEEFFLYGIRGVHYRPNSKTPHPAAQP